MDSDDNAGGWLRAAALIRGIPGITPAQVKVCLLILAGRSTRQIAAELGISPRTVENHRYAIRKKMKRHGNLHVELVKVVEGMRGGSNAI